VGVGSRFSFSWPPLVVNGHLPIPETTFPSLQELFCSKDTLDSIFCGYTQDFTHSALHISSSITPCILLRTGSKECSLRATCQRADDKRRKVIVPAAEWCQHPPDKQSAS
jgi:hypothetical protein